MGLSWLDVKVNAFTDTDGKKWKRVLVKEASATDGVKDEVEENRYNEPKTAWLCDDGRLYVGNLYSGGETGAGINGAESPSVNNPKRYGKDQQYSHWYEVVG